MKLIQVCMSALLAVTSVTRADSSVSAAFDWKTLFGTYRYGTCENVNGPIWAVDPGHQKIVISANPFSIDEPEDHYLGMASFHDSDSPIVPTWNIRGVDQDPIHTIDEQTGAVVSTQNSRTTGAGIFSRIDWKYPSDSGSASLELKQEADGNVSYVMKRTSSYLDKPQEERCELVRVR